MARLRQVFLPRDREFFDLFEEAGGNIKRAAELQDRAAAAGRDPIPVTVSGAPPKPDVIERLAAAGVHRCTFYVPPAPAGEIERHIDKRAALVEEARQLTA